MKVALLAGGLGTRIMEETRLRPKPMVEVGGRPILHHIMSTYAAQGFSDFAVALGYKGEVIKDYFLNYRLLAGDLRLSLSGGRVHAKPSGALDWSIDLIDTGEKTMTGGRLARMQHLLGGSTFMVTYGDGVADVDLEALLAFHRSHGRIATLTAVRPPEHTTRLLIDEGDEVSGIRRSSCGDGWINGGYFVFEPEVFDYLGSDADPLESVALTRLAREGQLMAFRHEGFWQCMDTVAERDLLESMWRSGEAPWAPMKCGSSDINAKTSR